MAQGKTVSGIVTDGNEPLIGVTVQVKGNSKLGTVTDLNGHYSINVTSAGTILVYSYVGFETTERMVGNDSKIDIQLKINSKNLDEVVVVGYGTMKKSDLTGSVSQLKSEDFKSGNDLSAQQLMQGAFAGVNISQNSGKPGGSTTIRVRGGTSVNASNEPLYVIDGVPIDAAAGSSQSNISTYTNNYFDQETANPLSLLNPNDIESIDVLKDASATAIYGSRGANGVIMITTKKGKAGVQQLNYGYSVGFSTSAKKLDMLSADQYRQACKDMNLSINDGGESHNWQDEILRTALQQSHYLSFMSGGEYTNYRASLNYTDQNGIMRGSGQKNYNGRVNINHSALDGKLKFVLNMSYGETHADQAPTSSTVGSEMGSSMLYEAYVFNPTLPVYTPDGDFNDVRPYRVQPLSYISELTDKRINKRFIGNLKADWNFYKPFTFEVNLGYTNNDQDRNAYICKSNLLGEGDGGRVTIQRLKDYSKLLDTILKYDQKFGKHNIDAMAGYSYQYFWDEGFNTSAYGFLTDDFKWYNIAAASTIESQTSYAESNKLISFYGRLNYSYADRYLFTATVRHDGSSRFGANHKWGTFPSFAASWRITEEPFFHVKAISNLKLRASWGITGNQEIGNYNAISTLSAYPWGYIFGGEKKTVVLPQQYANPDLKWESTSQTDIGLDFGFFNNRLRGTVDWYYKKTKDLLLSVAVPSPSLITTQLANVGSVRNTGLEIELGYNIIQKKNFMWDANVNFATNSNKLTSLSNNKWSGDNVLWAPCNGQGLSGQYSQLIMVGHPLGTFYGKRFTGVDKNGMEQYANGGKSEIIGCAQPDFTYAIATSFHYKKWSLSLDFRGSQGNDVYNNTANNFMYLNSLPGRNVLASALTKGISVNQAKTYSSQFIEDGSFFRLDNMTIGYDFAVPALKITHAHVYVTGQNLFCISGYSGLDPEVNTDTSGKGSSILGVDYLSYPRSRTFLFGINVTF
ncbi:MAG: TonB-dependent receptor [Prevotella sp.]|nr:TonB-dependent receptor [Prevotella sp.]MCH4183644.1 TonB-dependent receptor [Prevotella sp.]MCH4212665.1 TonB-dependent receptor [Prevotella sp.]MCH4242460.1 TonB-dependent receptor [Prevotella sp.]